MVFTFHRAQGGKEQTGLLVPITFTSNILISKHIKTAYQLSLNQILHYTEEQRFGSYVNKTLLQIKLKK